MNNDHVMLLALLMTPGVGSATARQIVTFSEQAGIPVEKLADMDARSLCDLLPPGFHEHAPLILESRHYAGLAAELLERVWRCGAFATAIGDAEYPFRFKQFLGEDAPPLLFILGNGDVLHGAAAAIVGTRNPTENGTALARQCARLFADNEIAVVSGGAEGVDTAAHYAALEQGGQTVVVLPQGLLTYSLSYPMARALDGGKACLVSEFVPHADWQTHAAVTRNAAISALAHILCVIEPAKTGGSIRTARRGIEQGKRVFIHGSPLSKITLPGTDARDLIDFEGKIDEESLLAAWKAPSRGIPDQQELFEWQVGKGEPAKCPPS